jgi:serine/threonine protein kinase
MAPEQMTDAKNADRRADIYSLGRILFEMFTGRLQTLLTDTSSLDPSIAHVIDKCTQANPQRRYESVAELKHEFFSVMGVAPALSGNRIGTCSLVWPIVGGLAATAAFVIAKLIG